MSNDNTADFDPDRVNWGIAASRLSRGMDLALELGEKDLADLLAVVGLTTITSANGRAVAIAATGADMDA